MGEHGTNVEQLLDNPDEVQRRIAEFLVRAERNGEPSHPELTYGPRADHSYYRDLYAKETGRIESPGCEARLERHAQEMDRLRVEHERRAAWRLSQFNFEYRVEPDRQDGFGGYFSPPAWLNELFATANRPGRVLSGLMARFPLPTGVSSVNLQVISTGTLVGSEADLEAVPDQDFTDAAGTSAVAPFVGQADVALQLLEQSPVGAALDWAIFLDLSEAYDAQLEAQLITGTDGSGANIATATVPGLFSPTLLPSLNTKVYTNASPTGAGMWPLLAQAGAVIGDNRAKPPECWLMRTARWFWLQGSEDTATRPFGLSTQFYLGSDDATPDPVSGLMGFPVFLDDAIPAALTATVQAGQITGFSYNGTQDAIIALRPRDMILLEGEPRTGIYREPLSGSLGVRLQMHGYAAAITGRRPAGISVVGGTGFAVQAGY